VGIVAGQAAVFLDNAVESSDLGRIIVALGTKLGTGFYQQGTVFGDMWIVTVHTSAVGCSLVDNSRSRWIIVTL
jgi:hypothetical protein